MTTEAIELVEITTTVGSQQEAELIGMALLESKQAACIQIIGPITSIYRWQGSIRQDQEWKILVKTPAFHAESTMQAIKQSHPYEVPEILCLPVIRTTSEYSHWVAESVRA